MGSAVEACCKQPGPSSDPIQPKKNVTNKKTKKITEDAASVPDSTKTNAQTTDDQNGHDANNMVQNLSDEKIEKILDKRAKIRKKI